MGNDENRNLKVLDFALNFVKRRRRKKRRTRSHTGRVGVVSVVWSHQPHSHVVRSNFQNEFDSPGGKVESEVLGNPPNCGEDLQIDKEISQNHNSLKIDPI